MHSKAFTIIDAASEAVFNVGSIVSGSAPKLNTNSCLVSLLPVD
ncbi:MAG: hypothetical protein E7I48_10570 [Clostridium celatum]|jgi:hypothetical protein|nr:hypothetical protein [Clostridium celatum]